MQPREHILHLPGTIAKTMRLLLQKSSSEEQLILACKAGKRKAQQELYEKYASRMLAVCCRYTGNQAEAEDVMMNAFFKVFTKMEQFQSQGSFEGWIRRIMVNEALSHIRKYKNMSVEVDIEKASRQPDIAKVEQNLAAADLEAMISELPIGYRTVFNMYAIEGYSHKEISEMLDISESTSKSQLSRARSYLQKKLLTIEGKVANYNS